LGELFTLLHLVDSYVFPNRGEFEGKYAQLQTTGGAKEVNDLQKAIQPYFFRRMKYDVEKALPKREETLISVELTTLQKQSVSKREQLEPTGCMKLELTLTASICICPFVG
jgi:SNF2 family DNA or RNA helicase